MAGSDLVLVLRGHCGAVCPCFLGWCRDQIEGPWPGSVLGYKRRADRLGRCGGCADDRRRGNAGEFLAAVLGLRDSVENPFVDACVMYLVNILE